MYNLYYSASVNSTTILGENSTNMWIVEEDAILLKQFNTYEEAKKQELEILSAYLKDIHDSRMA